MILASLDILPRIYIAVGAVTAVWVYRDATKHKIGKLPKQKSLANMSAGGWAVASLFIWVVALPAYMMNRCKLMEAADAHSVTVSGRSAKAAVLALIGGIWFLSGFPFSALPIGETPKCNSDAAIAAAKDAFEDDPSARGINQKLFDIQHIRETAYSAEPRKKRTCEGIALTNHGWKVIMYIVEENQNGEPLVEVRWY